ncbi:GDP-mannose 4,6-dehydratase [Bdellovibrionota bacterium FG-2]
MCGCWGRGQDPLSPYSGVISIFSRLSRDHIPLQIHGGGTQTRDFISVHDIVAACFLALPPTTVSAEAINLGTGKATSIRQLAEQISGISRGTPSLVATPSRAADVLHSLADISQAERILGWKPRVTLVMGLKELLSEIPPNAPDPKK